MGILLFIGILVVLILVHEFGHFSVAKLFKIRVDEFGIFFPPRITAFKKGETEYSINWLPFGGFVRIFGENPEEGTSDPRSLVNKPRLVQAAVIVAGVFFNLVFAWLVLSAGYMTGLPSSVDHVGVGQVRDAKPMVTGVYPNSPAETVGLMAEDQLVHLQTGVTALPDGFTAEEATNFIIEHQDDSLGLTVLRDGEEKSFIARAKEGIVPGRKALGLQLDDVGTLQLPVHLALVQGGYLTYQMTIATAEGLAGFFSKMFTGVADFSSVSGPIGIVAFGGTFVQQGFAAIVIITASISIALAIFNVIPIPGLDGGKLLFIIVEGIIRRPISRKLSTALTIAGFVLLISLMLVVSYHDIAKLVG